MSVALIHYHLRPGGVTRVIEAQSEALSRAGIAHVILSGTAPEGPARLPVTVVPSLDYHKIGEREGADSPQLFRELRQAAGQALNAEPDCWHFHNPTLGKNGGFPGLLASMAGSKTPLALHLHDFAEDGRPENYENLLPHEHLYPLAPQIRYLTVNSRDQAILLSSGVPAEQTMLLPNAVRAPAESPRATRESGDPFVLYPVRGIRRKNLGEFCLLSALAPPGTSFALALAPVNPAWRPIYDQWTQAAKQYHLPVEMGVVGRSSPRDDMDSSYASWLAHSTHLVTTSIAEGFGLSFLEPLAQGRPLLGRNLPEITSHFVPDDVNLGALYQELLIPRTWVSENHLRALLRDHLRHLYHSCGESLPDRIITETLATLDRGRFLDFGNLPEELQLEIFPRALLSPGDLLINDGSSSLPATEWLAEALEQHVLPAAPEALEPYSIAHYAEAHQALYRELTSATPSNPTWLDRRAVLGQFLTPERFHFLRS
ncbi:MAG: hypothetical protein CMN05_00300 [Roseibacillus sp.]|jgi:glycosyltransferase involved in cell wall biosynthesis|nr:hypothetical protein [Roseibacillus sp.]MBP35222.1 hypothetical protein [Roseibacillus sp.]MCP4730751.1 glycosyltransferase family 4 protein [Roseibacillus sp.]MDP7308157.1 glycosyltransferase family 4 protein [Roseibacillus sp.]HJM62083.1 glycosyltransferase family 4 protein [Roseibacillus sp.]|tara:strand:+ start:13680 stop:15137 length:1458 start_codon:yes stop_codon:yes gene_type:complete